ncbi:GNAT family N-acetyltransferase [Bordetella genomosp. 9]|nr:GNAT family N-acetyltransferase [Bordetella genomosp. 9]
MYIERMGKLPAPMKADYAALAASGDLYVLRAHGVIAGAILLTQDRNALKVNNLVVGQADQGKGYGRELMLFAERMVRSRNLRALTLYTNALMHENIALYQKIGFVVTDRVSEHGFDRVYFRKQLAP